jgi:hypothetical protein
MATGRSYTAEAADSRSVASPRSCSGTLRSTSTGATSCGSFRSTKASASARPSGRRPRVVPRVFGLTLRMARTRIRAKHRSVGRIRRARSSRVGGAISVGLRFPRSSGLFVPSSATVSRPVSADLAATLMPPRGARCLGERGNPRECGSEGTRNRCRLRLLRGRAGSSPAPGITNCLPATLAVETKHRAGAPLDEEGRSNEQCPKRDAFLAAAADRRRRMPHP